jgi:hypothetical protein
VDAAISQRMGLFVVGRLSDRHGIRVQLRPSGEQAGTTSLVMLPDAITHGGGGDYQPMRDEFTVSQIIPEQQQSFQGESFGGQQQKPVLTAADLGFDDSRYEVPDDARELDPVGRSLMREERRAALEAQAQGSEAVEGSQTYAEGFEAQPAYDNGQPSFNGAPAYDGAQGVHEEQQTTYDQQTSYEEPQQAAYDEAYFPSTGGYPEPSYTEPVQQEHAGMGGAAPESLSAFGEPSYQDDWPQQDAYQGGYRPDYAPEAESPQVADAAEQDSVGFGRPGPAPSAAHTMTDAGLPRRGSAAAGNGRRPAEPATKQAAPASSGIMGDDWRSSNDDRWQRAEQLKKPKAGGVTSSGLPRRVPKANLVEGTAESTPQGGPQVSRAPEDVRGRLSNLRRGVERGRNAGSETNGQGLGPDSTYNQER